MSPYAESLPGLSQPSTAPPNTSQLFCLCKGRAWQKEAKVGEVLTLEYIAIIQYSQIQSHCARGLKRPDECALSLRSYPGLCKGEATGQKKGRKKKSIPLTLLFDITCCTKQDQAN